MLAVGGTVVVVVVVASVVVVAVVVVGAGVVVVVVDGAAQVGVAMVFVSRVMAASRASSLPVTEAPVRAFTEVRAITVPANTEFAPSVAELPTCQ
jgi:type IV secretory pathway TrbL component